MMRGPKPTPTHLRVLRGNPGKRALPTNEPQPEQPISVPDAPAFVTGYASDEWYRVGTELYRLGMLTNVDLQSLAAYCVAYGRWRTAEELIAKMASKDIISSGLIVKSAGELKQNPLIPIARKACLDMVRFAGEFGLTPAARSRIDGIASASTAPSKFDGLLG
jgi:P27 family predicted phage terminase small subunit